MRNPYFKMFPLLSFLLSACSRLYTPPIIKTHFPISEWHHHRYDVSQLSHYQALGSFSYISSHNKKMYARFNWQQSNAESSRFTLTNPLGVTEIHLTLQSNNIVQLINKKAKYPVANDPEAPEAIVDKLVSIDIPFNNFRQWILGLPGDTHDFTFDERGLLSSLNYQHNGTLWTVIYHSYHTNMIPALPANVEIRHENHHITLKIDSWNL